MNGWSRLSVVAIVIALEIWIAKYSHGIYEFIIGSFVIWCFIILFISISILIVSVVVWVIVGFKNKTEIK